MSYTREDHVLLTEFLRDTIFVDGNIVTVVSTYNRLVNDKLYFNFRGYSRLLEVVNKHTPMTVPPKESMTKLPWVHTVISNCKRELLGTHHSIGKEYLQTYLNEFCYKLNRRNFETDLFDRMLLCGIQK